VQLVSAPFTLLLDSLSFLCSAGSIALIARESSPVRLPSKATLIGDIGEGLTAVARHPMLRALAAYRVTGRFFGNGIGALYTLYGLHDLALGPVLLGLTIGIGGMSNLVGTFLVGPLTRRFGVRRSMLAAAATGSFTALLVPLAHGPLLIGFGTLALCQAFDVIQPIYEVNALSLRQTITPPRVLGRVNAAMQVLEGGLGPLGAIVAGVLAGQIGVRPTLFLAALGASPSILWLVFSPLATIRPAPVTFDGDSSATT
jgi:MFS family permease